MRCQNIRTELLRFLCASSEDSGECFFGRRPRQTPTHVIHKCHFLPSISQHSVLSNPVARDELGSGSDLWDLCHHLTWIPQMDLGKYFFRQRHVKITLSASKHHHHQVTLVVSNSGQNSSAFSTSLVWDPMRYIPYSIVCILYTF